MKMRMAILTLSILSLGVILSAYSFVNPLGPTVLPVIAIDEKKLGDLEYPEFSIWKNPEEAIALLSSGKVDLIILPITLGANLYTKGIDVALIGVHEWKVFYLVSSKDEEFEGWKKLKGKKIYTAHGRGQTVDVLMRYFMVKDGVIPDEDIQILYAPPQEVVALFKSGKIEYAALPEPFVTMAISGGKGKIILDFQKEWGKVTGLHPRIPIAGLFVRREFLENNWDLVKKFEEILTASIKWMKNNPDEDLKLVKKYLKIPSPILKESMKRMKFDYVPISKCKKEVLTFLRKMNELYPAGMPKIPDERFFVDISIH